ncbi:hypothetical protein Tsubulata_034985 [Turnera subulata]|uniref:Ureide permease n=1 Tax=Turnera subulata TaxID=218843 RepID=A0A9Q0F5K2_9ROSI|nr:hypothetical protein Tsubulata_034985 [Turnera subulata]
MFAMAGGVALSLGNLSTQYAWAFVGLSLATVIFSSISFVIGTTLNYFLDDKINNAKILFPGAACFLIAAFLVNTIVAVPWKRFYFVFIGLGNLQQHRNILPCAFCPQSTLMALIALLKLNFGRISDTATCKEAIGDSGKKDVGDESSISEVKFGAADFLVELENRRANNGWGFSFLMVSGKSTMIGLGITLFAGLCFSLFAPAFNLATNDQLHTLKKGVPKLVLYTAFFWFSVSCFILGIFLNVTFLYRPVLNLPRSSIKAYLKDWNGRGWALLAGFLCGFGNDLQFMGGQAAGYAAADVGQALPLVSTFWGILLFGEY